MDLQVQEIRRAQLVVAEPSRKKRKIKESTHEQLTLTLLRELPGLLKVFRGDNAILSGLTYLPRYFGELDRSVTCRMVTPDA